MQITVIGLGYVGLPLALALGRAFPQVTGFDINQRRIAELQQGHDRTGEVTADELAATQLRFTADPETIRATDIFIVAVPTPIDQDRRPDLRPLIRASETVGRAIKPGAIVCFESTVYPGVTEEVCGPVIARVSGMTSGVDFTLGYSPERINPGDKEHTIEKIVKVVAGQDAQTLETLAGVYGTIVQAGIHRAPSIKVAEAAKVIENTQRDLNIALMNELALIFDRMGISTRDVLAAAGTKWNFLRFAPGLVGGHCIGVDPYYLTSKAEELGYTPQVILAGRRINDGMGPYIAQRTVKLLINADRPVKGARVAILGLTFKENVPDLRNSRVPDIIHELRQFGIAPLVHDPLADPVEAHEEYGVTLCGWDDLHDMDALIIAVSHEAYRTLGTERLTGGLVPGGVLIDVKGLFGAKPEGVVYWSL